MNTRKNFVKFYLLSILFIYLSAFNFSFAKSNESLTKDLAYKVVAEYCKLEFQHDFNRDKLMKMSESYKDRIDKLSGSVEMSTSPKIVP